MILCTALRMARLLYKSRSSTSLKGLQVGFAEPSGAFSRKHSLFSLFRVAIQVLIGQVRHRTGKMCSKVRNLSQKD